MTSTTDELNSQEIERLRERLAQRVSQEDTDPTPWCSGCGAMKKKDCHCGPIADNE